MKLRLTILILITAYLSPVAQSERIKDIVDIQGIRTNPIRGIGLVIGLADTGDSTKPSQQMLTSILRDSGIVLSSTDAASGNVAIVMVTAQLGPFAREGSRIDVDVSSIGDADSLRGGILLPTPLKGLDGQIYAVANGGLSLGGWGASGNQASINKNHLTVGRIPDGAIVEKSELATFVENIAGQRFITLNLRNVDFSTAGKIAKVINQSYEKSAVAVDAGTIQVKVPDEFDQTRIAAFIDNITKGDISVDTPAVVVINERTGTIVVGENVGISAVAISQGSLVVKVKETQNVFQPNAMFSDAGETKVVDETLLEVDEEPGYLVPVPQTVTVSDLAKTLNAIGATPSDLVAIFNALKRAGALQARLEIM
jgi:flagellar P-ring protein precursor FlgI